MALLESILLFNPILTLLQLAGVHSFDFLGLGYKVDWPVSIVLTSAALEIYAHIFNFLIRVKLAVFALTDVWCSLKVWYRLLVYYIIIPSQSCILSIFRVIEDIALMLCFMNYILSTAW